MQSTLDFGAVGRIAVGAEHEADVADRGARRLLQPGKGIDVLPYHVTLGCHLEYTAPNAFADERVAGPQPLTAEMKKLSKVWLGFP